MGEKARKNILYLIPDPNVSDDDKLTAFLKKSCLEGMLVDRINDE